jgi:excisionase family DNA binding protein
LPLIGATDVSFLIRGPFCEAEIVENGSQRLETLAKSVKRCAVGQSMRVSAHDKTNQLLVTFKDAVRLLGLGRNKIYELLAAQELTSVYFGRARRITSESIHDLIARRAK